MPSASTWPSDDGWVSAPPSEDANRCEHSLQEFIADGSIAGEVRSVVGHAVSTGHQRVAEQWQVPPDAYWIRAWIEVDGSKGGDPISGASTTQGSR